MSETDGPDDPMPLDGWPLRLAVGKLLTKPFQFILSSSLLAYELQRNEPQISHLRGVLWDFLRERVAKMEIVATGFAPGALSRSPIEATFVQDATPDFDVNSLRLGDRVYDGVRFAEAILLPTSKSADTNLALPASTGAQSSQEIVDAWIAAHAKPGLKRDSLFADSAAAVNATFRQNLAAWEKLPPALRGTRGTKKP
jgi:hypothetical protein